MGTMAKKEKKEKRNKHHLTLIEVLAIITIISILVIISIPAFIINDKQKNIMEIEFVNLMKKNELETKCYPSSSEWKFYRRCESTYPEIENFTIEFLKFTTKSESKIFFEKNTALKKEKIKKDKESGAMIKTSLYKDDYKVIIQKWDSIIRITTTKENKELADKMMKQIKEL